MRKGRKRTFFARLGRGLGDLLAKYNRRNGPLLAKGLGFSFLFGLVPLLFLSVSLAGYLYRVAPGLQRFITEEFLVFIPSQARAVLLSHITTAAGNWSAIGILGVLILMGVSMALFDSIERALATMLSAPRRKFHLGRLISLALMVGAVLLFFGAAALSTTATYFRNAISFSPALVYWGGKVLSGLMFAFILLGLYYLFARRRLRFWPTFVIALGASLAWQIIVSSGSGLIRYTGRRVIVFGALAWVTVFLIYLRVLAELLLFSSLLVSSASPPRESE
ncbi:MAG: YihY/virulence factor BrkB family protein [candidate division WOR-3 bacterium]|nr:YihY/virulence factor BrkB family protein [candidate division WOR-3 bacterium]